MGVGEVLLLGAVLSGCLALQGPGGGALRQAAAFGPPADSAQVFAAALPEIESPEADVRLRALPRAELPPDSVLASVNVPEVAPARLRSRTLGSGRASYYGPGFAGRRTASGERFNPEQLTAAHPTLPFGSRVRVTNLKNGRSVVVRINDRGPFSRNRVIDLSKAAAQRIGMVRSGTARVKLELLSEE